MMKRDARGQGLKLAEKYSGDGRDLRTYVCEGRGKVFDVDLGVATWKAFSAAREADDEKPT
jgi:hypothetical protein